ncbi:receptor-like cytosolic serine/threonine-protein kinase RBK1 [Iris pallida]|uniref:Receptor-like cytosolic serine/threonine-protein kinase RBK1 n=1 Tax=Iris pallida TaxID=29817 RepID=A0AAX6EYU6_IRIPA|nr:receptor-like cytosolic serine/threonine-protein kinase RBK1 [Iris pallida]
MLMSKQIFLAALLPLEWYLITFYTPYIGNFHIRIIFYSYFDTITLQLPVLVIISCLFDILCFDLGISCKSVLSGCCAAETVVVRLNKDCSIR